MEYFVLLGRFVINGPLERTRLLLQGQGENIKQGKLLTPYKNCTECLVRTWKIEGKCNELQYCHCLKTTIAGVWSLWRGNLTASILSIVIFALNRAWLQLLQQMKVFPQEDLFLYKLMNNVVQFGISTFLTLSIVYSLAYARTRLATDVLLNKDSSRQFSGVIDVYRKTIRSDGYLGLYRGFTISCIAATVYRALLFCFSEGLKPVFLGETASVTASTIFAAMLHIGAGSLTYPLSTVVTRIMMTSCETEKYKSFLDCILQVSRSEGLHVLMNGFELSVLNGVYSSVLMLVAGL